MFARTMTAKTLPGKREEVRKIVAESVLPAAKAQKGFQHAFFLENADDPDDGLMLSLWASREDADAGVQSGYLQEQVQKVAPFLTALPERKSYEVTVEG